MKKNTLTTDQAQLINDITAQFTALNTRQAQPTPYKYFDIQGMMDAKTRTLEATANYVAEMKGRQKNLIDSARLQLCPIRDEFQAQGIQSQLIFDDYSAWVTIDGVRSFTFYARIPYDGTWEMDCDWYVNGTRFSSLETALASDDAMTFVKRRLEGIAKRKFDNE
jgi:hypothetical protein